jgi:excisionase family DNA binding protein
MVARATDSGPRSSTRLLYSIPEAATMLGLSRSTLYLLIQTRQLKTRRIGRRRMIPKAALEAFIKSDHTTTSPSASVPRIRRQSL